MLLGPQTYPLMRETGASRALFQPMSASGPAHPSIPRPSNPQLSNPRLCGETTRPSRGPEEQVDIALYAMMSPCCGIAYWPETGAADPASSARDPVHAVADLALVAWRRIAPTLAFLGRSVAFLTAIAVMGVFGLQLLVMF